MAVLIEKIIKIGIQLMKLLRSWGAFIDDKKNYHDWPLVIQKKIIQSMITQTNSTTLPVSWLWLEQGCAFGATIKSSSIW